MLLLFLLLCNDVDLTEEKMHGELWAFNAVSHWAGNGSFNVLFFINLNYNFLQFPCLFTNFFATLSVLHRCISSFLLIPLVFIYITGSLDKYSNDCVQGQRDKSHLYSNQGCIH